jgi:hypothetical protein
MQAPQSGFLAQNASALPNSKLAMKNADRKIESRKAAQTEAVAAEIMPGRSPTKAIMMAIEDEA